MSEQTYLGDGVYASFDGYQIRLATTRDNGIHEIYLEPDTAMSLLDYMRKCWLMKIVVKGPNEK
jgi:hypothetical protein